MAGSTVERHTCTSFDYFDLDVDVTTEGDVEIKFRFPDAVESIEMPWDDFREVIDFIARHGLSMTNPWIGEYAETVDGASE